MIKSVGLVFVILGAIGLILGIFGIFGSLVLGISPWAFAILGLIFFLAGIGLLKKGA